MQTIRITTSQNIDIDYEVAGIGERMLASLIDYAVFFAIFIITIIISTSNGGNFKELVTGVIFISYAVVYVFYDLVCEIFFNGQSLGKRLMKIKVISIDGGQASVGQYFLRWLFRIVDFTLSSSACAVISVAVTPKNQRLGDLVAGTTLIRTHARTQIDAVAFTPVNQDYTPVFTEVTRLKDKDIELLHEVVASYIKSGNAVILYNTANKLKQILGVTTMLDDFIFLQTVIRDYNHMVAAADVL